MCCDYNWKLKRDKKALLAFEDGTIFRGYSIGAAVDKLGEVVFNTGLTGYQEIITDPSYAGQIVTMTYPEIGNTGINKSDFESRGMFLSGLIINNLNPPNNWRSETSLDDFLSENKTPGIAGIDTRALTEKLRKEGTLKAFIHCSEEYINDEQCVENAKKWIGLDNQDYASKVTCENDYNWDELNLSKSWGVCDSLPKIDFNVVAYDFGIKWNILRNLRLHGMNVRIVPAHTSFSDVLSYKPDGVFLSNGPADPAAVQYAVNSAKELIGKIPVMGICLGHQLLSLACGARTYRLKFGHHGCNHPVKNLISGKVEITSQNHNYATDAESINDTNLDVTHINLNDNTVEGIRHKTEPMFAVQYHPEAAPGPHDPSYLFNQFKELMNR
ncbi:MAG: glutamine-hydrolyzing carbamoyl-phosphate synthase small subunit [bacterium]|nr:glutamine-hydrolyzing carbamoyl-phosphate synthase small subunit [bacterium]